MGNLKPIKLVEVDIELVGACNLRCAACPIKDMKRRPPMEVSVFEKLVDETPDTVYLYLCHMGEPTMHPDLLHLLRYAAMRKAENGYVVLTTNGTWLQDTYTAAILTSGINRVCISLDGIVARTHEQNRVGSIYHDVLGRAVEAIQIRDRIGSATRIEVQLLRRWESLPEIEEYIKFWKKLLDPSRDNIRIKASHTFCERAELTDAGYYKHENRMTRGTQFPPSKPLPDYGCSKLAYSQAVLSTGQLSLCAMDTLGEYNLGHVNDGNVYETWKKANAEWLDKRIPTELCKKCDQRQWYGDPYWNIDQIENVDEKG